MNVVGVDGCRGGWLAVTVVDGAVADVAVHATFADVLRSTTAEAVGVDMPIGLPPPYPRPADIAARAFVGPRRSSVFATPARAVLELDDYWAANTLARELTGRGISKQSHSLRRRILEVDELARRDERVIEVHPEASFRELVGSPLPSKHTPAGIERRQAALMACYAGLPSAVPRDLRLDLLDAAAVAWTAARFARGDANPLPEDATARIGAIWK